MLENISKEIKIKAIEMLVKKGGGHFGGSLSSAEILTSIFFKVLKKSDKFIMSKAHASVILAVLFKKKIINEKLLNTYGSEDSY